MPTYAICDDDEEDHDHGKNLAYSCSTRVPFLTWIFIFPRIMHIPEVAERLAVGNKYLFVVVGPNGPCNISWWAYEVIVRICVKYTNNNNIYLNMLTYLHIIHTWRVETLSLAWHENTVDQFQTYLNTLRERESMSESFEKVRVIWLLVVQEDGSI